MPSVSVWWLAALAFQAPTVPSVRPPAALTVESVTDAAFTHNLALHSAGPQVLRVSILLDRIKFSPGEIDGVFGNNLAHTVIAFRRAHQLPLDPVVDQTAWNLLNADAGPLFVAYTITKQDARGPFTPIPGGMPAKARLKRLGYESVGEMLGERFHISPKLLAALNPDQDLDEAGTIINVPNVLTPSPPRSASLCVNATDLTLQGLDVDGHILMSYPVSVGSKHDPLPVGQWQVVAIHPYPVYTYDSIHFWDASGPRTKAHVAPGPNNPVGVVWIGLSKNHYGIHGTPSPALIGRGQSHGCIRMTNWDAAELSAVIQPNLNVVLKAQ
jgi:lipoprotein-anchoring transpeptidase ErfK/SrfK